VLKNVVLENKNVGECRSHAFMQDYSTRKEEDEEKKRKITISTKQWWPNSTRVQNHAMCCPAKATSFPHCTFVVYNFFIRLKKLIFLLVQVQYPRENVASFCWNHCLCFSHYCTRHDGIYQLFGDEQSGDFAIFDLVC